MASISTRVHIRWSTDDPSEPTSTLVLTSPRRYFVDTRPLKVALQGTSNLLPIDQLDWAFGGTSTSTPIPHHPDGTTTTTQVTHAVFRHWVDSRSKDPEKDIVDEGDMFPQSDDEGLTLEKGRMVNPATGVESDYEELWRDEEVAPHASVVVLQLQRDEELTRGLFVLLGRFAQCVLRVGDELVAERWEQLESGGDGGPLVFTRVFKVGNEASPSLDDLLAAALEGAREGDQVKTATGTWKVVETSA